MSEVTAHEVLCATFLSVQESSINNYFQKLTYNTNYVKISLKPVIFAKVVKKEDKYYYNYENKEYLLQESLIFLVNTMK